MSKLHFTTKHANEATVQRNWYVVDGTNQTVGRMCARIAAILRGKNKVEYTPHVDTGDFVIVINAEKVKLTGNKEEDKIYYRHTGWQGHLKEAPASRMREKHPEQIVELAVKGMLPRGNLGRAMLKKLKVYRAAEHPHSAQKPETLSL